MNTFHIWCIIILGVIILIKLLGLATTYYTKLKENMEFIKNYPETEHRFKNRLLKDMNLVSNALNSVRKEFDDYDNGISAELKVMDRTLSNLSYAQSRLINFTVSAADSMENLTKALETTDIEEKNKYIKSYLTDVAKHISYIKDIHKQIEKNDFTR